MPKFMTKNKPTEAHLPSSHPVHSYGEGSQLLLPPLPSAPTWNLADGRRNEFLLGVTGLGGFDIHPVIQEDEKTSVLSLARFLKEAQDPRDAQD